MSSFLDILKFCYSSNGPKCICKLTANSSLALTNILLLNFELTMCEMLLAEMGDCSVNFVKQMNGLARRLARASHYNSNCTYRGDEFPVQLDGTWQFDLKKRNMILLDTIVLTASSVTVSNSVSDIFTNSTLMHFKISNN